MVLGYLRQNTLAFIALCVALFSLGGATAYAVNTVRSTDIVDGQVLTQDLGNNAVTTGKIKDGQVTNADIAANSIGSGKIIDNQITGADVNEATLGRVPDAGGLSGFTTDNFRVISRTATAQTDTCAHNQIWTACAPNYLNVPVGHYYDVTVTSTVTMNPGASDLNVLLCPAKDGPTCLYQNPEIMTFRASVYSSITTTATEPFSPGTYYISTAIKTPTTIPASAYAHTVTTIEVHENVMEYAGDEG